jgi:hypothetical protein
MSLTRRQMLRSALVGALAVPAGASILAHPRTARAETRDQERERYYDSEYTYCDAKLLAKLWKEDLSETKARIGRKIGWNDLDTLKSELAKARRGKDRNATKVCPYDEAGYSYADMQVLSLLWDQRMSETKARAARKLVWGDKKVLDTFLQRAWKQAPHRRND